MSIPEIKEWLETNQRNLALGAAFFLVGAICFALGYLYHGEAARAQIVVEQLAPTSAKTSAKVVPPNPPKADKPAVPPPVTIVYTPPASPVAPAFTEVSA